MALIEEVFPNKDGLFGGSTGKKYEKGETEEINGIRWSKPDGCAPGEVVKIEKD
jgi:hypothetical protein